MSSDFYWLRIATIFSAPLALASVAVLAIGIRPLPIQVVANGTSIMKAEKRRPVFADFEKVSRALKTPVLVEFDETPLVDVLAELSRQANLPIVYDVSLSPKLVRLEKEPVTANLSDQISLRSALTIILDSLVLQMRVEVDRIIVVPEKWPPDRSRELYSSASYHCGSLHNYTTQAQLALIQEIERTIEPESWEAAGGRGRIEPAKSVFHIDVYQSSDVHGEIEQLLDLRGRKEAVFVRDNDDALSDDELRQKYAYISLASRLAHEKRKRDQPSTAPLALDEAEEEFELGQGRFPRYRVLSLKLLHEGEVAKFVESDGFGFQ